MDRLVIHDLLDETEEDGDDDGGFDGLAEDDEEDGDGEEVFGHLLLTYAHGEEEEEGKTGGGTVRNTGTQREIWYKKGGIVSGRSEKTR